MNHEGKPTTQEDNKTSEKFANSRGHWEKEGKKGRTWGSDTVQYVGFQGLYRPIWHSRGTLIF